VRYDLRVMRLFSVISLFALAAMMSTASQANSVTFKTLSPEVAGGDVTVSGLLSKPDGTGPFPAVVLLHTCGGL